MNTNKDKSSIIFFTILLISYIILAILTNKIIFFAIISILIWITYLVSKPLSIKKMTSPQSINKPSEVKNHMITLLYVPPEVKIATIKLIREIYDFDLTTAKKIVETPDISIDIWISKDAAENAAYRLENLGVDVLIDNWERSENLSGTKQIYTFTPPENLKIVRCKYCQQPINSTTGICEYCGAPPI